MSLQRFVLDLAQGDHRRVRFQNSNGFDCRRDNLGLHGIDAAISDGVVARFPVDTRPRSGVRWVRVDAGDLPAAAGISWIVASNGYVQGRGAQYGEWVLLHRVIVGAAAAGFEIHHRNGDKLDNRRANLQVVTRAEHMRLHVKT